ncbi:hypothetical protein ACTFIR_012381 [Dictyostelium discoideum]
MNKLIILILSVLLIVLSVNSNETKWDYSSSGSSDTTPAFCTGPSFDLGEISDLEDQLNIDWISLTEDNDLFWTSTCAVVAGSPITNEHDYFVAGLKLYTQHNLTSALISENIYPSDQDTYESDIISILLY